MADTPDQTIDIRAVGGARWLTNDSVLRVTVFNAAAGVSVRLSGRRLQTDGRTVAFVHRMTPATNRTASTFDLELSEGWLLGAEVSIGAGTPQDGQTYAVLSLGRGRLTAFEELDTFAADTISAARRLAWPGSPNRGPLDGKGALRVIVGTNPAAGAEISETVPTGARWQLLAFKSQLVASATVANRTGSLIIDDGAVTYLNMPGFDAQPALGLFIRSWGAGQAFVTGAPTNVIGYSMPANLFLPAGHRIRSLTLNIQAGDQYSAIEYAVLEWIEGA